MLTELCQELRNWFEVEKHFGSFAIEDDLIILPDGLLQDGQHFRIVGSVFNDGVHQYGVDSLRDEVFEGAIWSMAIPPAVIDLSERISEWNAQYGEAILSPYSSESFGGYSYQKAGSGQGNTSAWQSVFANELNRWRKI